MSILPDQPLLGQGHIRFSQTRTKDRPESVAEVSKELGPGITIVPAAYDMHNHLLQFYGHGGCRQIHANTHKKRCPERIPEKNTIIPWSWCHFKGQQQKMLRLIEDTCVPSHLIEAGFLEEETALQQYDQKKKKQIQGHNNNICNRNVFHGTWKNYFFGSFFPFLNLLETKHREVHVYKTITFLSLLLDIIVSWRAHHDHRFPNLPKFDYRSAKPQTMPWQACHLWSQAKVCHCNLFLLFTFFYPGDLKLGIKAEVMCCNRKHTVRIQSSKAHLWDKNISIDKKKTSIPGG